MDSENSLLDHDERRFVRHTNEKIWFVLDNLEAVCDAGMAPTAFKKLETEVGFNHEPLGALMNKSLRQTYKPTEHQLADWQHVFCQDGIANSAIALLLERLPRHGFTLQMVQTFVEGASCPGITQKSRPSGLSQRG